MTSKLIVDSIEGRTGATVSLPQDSNYVLEQWRLTTNEAVSGNIVDNWERVDDASSSNINAGMTQSSGVFTFPSTGLWLVTAQVAIYLDSDGTAGVYVQVSSDSGGAYDDVGVVYEGGDSAANQMGSMSFLVNVTNASTFRFQLKADSLSSGSEIVGNTNYNRTALLFERKGPSQ
jgi:hypothetical protein